MRYVSTLQHWPISSDESATSDVLCPAATSVTRSKSATSTKTPTWPSKSTQKRKKTTFTSSSTTALWWSKRGWRPWSTTSEGSCRRPAATWVFGWAFRFSRFYLRLSTGRKPLSGFVMKKWRTRKGRLSSKRKFLNTKILNNYLIIYHKILNRCISFFFLRKIGIWYL